MKLGKLGIHLHTRALIDARNYLVDGQRSVDDKAGTFQQNVILYECFGIRHVAYLHNKLPHGVIHRNEYFLDPLPNENSINATNHDRGSKFAVFCIFIISDLI